MNADFLKFSANNNHFLVIKLDFKPEIYFSAQDRIEFFRFDYKY